MNHHEFFNFLKKWRGFEKYPPASGWPAEIIWGEAFWANIKKLYDLTSAINYEHETSFFYVAGEIISTDPFKGEQTKVKTGHQLKVKYTPTKTPRYYDRQIIVDDKIVKVESVKTEQANKSIDLGFLYNVHSHPVHYIEEPRAGEISNSANVMSEAKKIPTYGFFSAVDINSLLVNSAMVSGLVTNEFWLVGKTDKVIKQIGEVGIEMLQKVSNKAFEGDNYLEDVIKTQMPDWGLVFYRAKFGQVLRRVI